MRRNIRGILLGFVVLAMLMTGAPAMAQLDPLDPRFDIENAQLVQDTGTGSLWVLITPGQPWVEPPLDPYSSYVRVSVEYAGRQNSLQWEEFQGTTSVDGSADAGIVAWTGYVLEDGSLLIWLPFTPQPGEEFWVDIETGIAPTAADAGAGSTWGMRLTAEDAMPFNVLFGSNYPVWNLVSNEKMAPPVTSTTVAAAGTPATTVVTRPEPATETTTTPKAQPAAPSTTPTRAAATETGGAGFPGMYITLTFLALVLLALIIWWRRGQALFNSMRIRRQPDPGFDPQPTPQEEEKKFSRQLDGPPGAPPPPQQDDDTLLPNFRPTGIYVHTEELERELRAQEAMEDNVARGWLWLRNRTKRRRKKRRGDETFDSIDQVIGPEDLDRLDAQTFGPRTDREREQELRDAGICVDAPDEDDEFMKGLEEKAGQALDDAKDPGEKSKKKKKKQPPDDGGVVDIEL